jgi:hypothetical protein
MGLWYGHDGDSSTWSVRKRLGLCELIRTFGICRGDEKPRHLSKASASACGGTVSTRKIGTVVV